VDGHGISISSFAGIAAGLRPMPHAELVRTAPVSAYGRSAITDRRRVVTWAVCFRRARSEKILVTYAKRQIGNKGLWRTSLAPALKAQHVGVIPPIFASSIIPFPRDPCRLVTAVSPGNLELPRGPIGSAFGLMIGPRVHATPGQPAVRDALRERDHFSAFLHRAAINPQERDN